jgi:bile acid:Na+ symporter, BASS family
MPLLGFGLAILFHLPPELSVGLILVGCCPGGTASNLMTFLAGGDVALTVALTSLTTLIAPIATPLLLYFLAKHWISIAPEKMFVSILQIVIIPIILGVFIRRCMPQMAQKTVPFLPVVSILLILSIIATVINVNASIILQANGWLFLSVILHNMGGLVSGHILGRILKVNSKQRSALTFEIGMQDSGLGVALAVAYLGPLYALPSAIFSVWQNILGPVLTTYFAKQLKRPVGSEGSVLSTCKRLHL